MVTKRRRGYDNRLREVDVEPKRSCMTRVRTWKGERIWGAQGASDSGWSSEGGQKPWERTDTRASRKDEGLIWETGKGSSIPAGGKKELSRNHHTKKDGQAVLSGGKCEADKNHKEKSAHPPAKGRGRGEKKECELRREYSIRGVESS